MRNKKIIKISVLLLVLAYTVLALVGCGVKVNVIGLSDYRYEHSEKYSVGNATLTQTVENIDINWMVGNVTISGVDGDSVSFSENSHKELTDDTMLHYWLDNTTLRIRFCGLGKWNFSGMNKNLTVLVPKNLVVNNLKVETLSADVNLSSCAVSGAVEIDTVSGDTEAHFSQKMNEFYGSSTSGEFMVTAPSVSRFEVESVSGTADLSTQKEPDFLDVDTTSGDINLTFPDDASFTLYYSTTSGDLYSDIKFSRSAIKYTFGEGNGKYNISTVSGDVRINANNQQ